jgi:ribosomal protein L16/L10AE
MLPSLSKLPKPATRALLGSVRFRSQLAPKNVKYIKRQKGVIPIPIGGSVKGTTLAFGEYGIRVKGNGGRLSADHLTVAEDVLKRKFKTVKGAKVYMRVFPSTPVSVKVLATRL